MKIIGVFTQLYVWSQVSGDKSYSLPYTFYSSGQEGTFFFQEAE